jgi:glutaredoxin
MSLLRPVFALEAKLQAGAYDKEAIQAAIQADADSAPVVLYTYSLSPFSSEAIRLLEAAGVAYREIELAPEWFLMLGEGAAKRAELGEMYGRTSLPHVFVGGKSIGGLYDGSPGLAAMLESGELQASLKPKEEATTNPFEPLLQVFR